MSSVAEGAAIAAILVCERSAAQSASSRAREKVVVSFVPLLQAFEMCAAIENPASCEVRSVIRFLWAKKLKPIEIYRQLCEVYGNNVISEAFANGAYVSRMDGVMFTMKRRVGGQAL